MGKEPARIHLVVGDDSNRRRQVVADVLKSAGLSPDDLDLESFPADGKPFNEWLAAVSQIPFWAPRRAVIVRNLMRVGPRDLFDDSARLDKNHPIVKALQTVPESGLLLLVADDEMGDSRRQDTLKKRAEDWGKAVNLAGGEITTVAFNDANVAQQVRDIAKASGKSISAAAANLLAEMVGNKAHLALPEIEKLILYVGDAPEIRESDVKTCVTPDPEYNVFKLVDAVLAGEPGRSLAQLRVLFHRAQDIQGEAFGRLFPPFHRQIRLTWQARVLLDHNVRMPSVPESVAALLPPKPNLLAEKDWMVQRAMKTAGRLDLDCLSDCLRYLVEADAELKGASASSSRPYDAIETAVLAMARRCAASREGRRMA